MYEACGFADRCNKISGSEKVGEVVHVIRRERVSKNASFSSLPLSALAGMTGPFAFALYPLEAVERS